MSGLETLPPDQRAALRLILTQGRGYAELATLLKLDVEAVRSRARGGAAALAGPGAAPPAHLRARIVDYLLGQQDDGERLVTFAELAESAAACAWARRLRDRLAPLARDELPSLPDAPANGAIADPARTSTEGTPLAPTTGLPANDADAAHGQAAQRPLAEVAAGGAPGARNAGLPPADQADAHSNGGSVVDAPAAASKEPAAASDGADDSSSSRLAGMALLAGIVAFAVAIAFVLLDGDDGSSPAATRAQTQAQPRTTTQPARTATTPQQPQLVAQVNLNATAAGGQAVGIGIVQRAGRRLGVAIEAQRLPANGAEDIYAVWLQGAPGTRFLGFVPRQVGADGTFTVSANLPRNARRYSTLLVTREGIRNVPQTPGEAILTGELRLSG